MKTVKNHILKYLGTPKQCKFPKITKLIGKSNNKLSVIFIPNSKLNFFAVLFFNFM